MPDTTDTGALAIELAKLHISLVASAVTGLAVDTQAVALRLAISDAMPFTLGLLAALEPSAELPAEAETAPPPEPEVKPMAFDKLDLARQQRAAMARKFDEICAAKGIAPADLAKLPLDTLIAHVREVIPPRKDGRPQTIDAESLPGWAADYAAEKAEAKA
jgi:hypothetical protein